MNTNASLTVDATAVGLIGAMRATRPGAELAGRLNALVARLGPDPHGALNARASERTQTTRMLLVVCTNASCAVHIRMTRRHIYHPGVPRCACGNPMRLASE